MPQGTIKKLTDRGFGFIEGERGDIFFHHSALEGTDFDALSVGQQVEYEEGSGSRQPGSSADASTSTDPDTSPSPFNCYQRSLHRQQT